MEFTTNKANVDTANATEFGLFFYKLFHVSGAALNTGGMNGNANQITYTLPFLSLRSLALAFYELQSHDKHQFFQ